MTKSFAVCWQKNFFRWHWTLRSVFGSSVFVITVIKTDWKSLWIQKRPLVIFNFNQCKMVMTGANLHHVKWIPVPIYQTETDSRIVTVILSRHCKMKITMENCTVYKSLSKPTLSIESIPTRTVTFIFEQRKMITPIEKLNRIKWVLKPITDETDYRVVTSVNRLCKMKITTGKNESFANEYRIRYRF